MLGEIYSAGSRGAYTVIDIEGPGHVAIDMEDNDTFAAAVDYVEQWMLSRPSLSPVPDFVLETCEQSFLNVTDTLKEDSQTAVEVGEAVDDFLRGKTLQSFYDSLAIIDDFEKKQLVDASGVPSEQRSSWLLGKLVQMYEATVASGPIALRGSLNTMIGKCVQFAAKSMFTQLAATVDPRERIAQSVAIASLALTAGLQLWAVANEIKEDGASWSVFSRAAMTLISTGSVMSLYMVPGFRQHAASIASLLPYVLVRDSLNAAMPTSDNAPSQGVASRLLSGINFNASQYGLERLISFVSSDAGIQNPYLKEAVVAAFISAGVVWDDVGSLVLRHVVNTESSSAEKLETSVGLRAPSGDEWVKQMQNGGAPRFQFITGSIGISESITHATGEVEGPDRIWRDGVVPAGVGMVLYWLFDLIGSGKKPEEVPDYFLPRRGY
ncbi:hypothetical protein ACIPL1_02435 [Pseudomonas sp. NPDC090202]|uniref:hypothetical protein n=1 Tax=unclassified Pseudomonas TaxID=196821 RepID=UPI003823BF30